MPARRRLTSAVRQPWLAGTIIEGERWDQHGYRAAPGGSIAVPYLAPPAPTAWVTPTCRPGTKVAWHGRIGLFLREAAEDHHVEVLIGRRTYRVRAGPR